MSLRRLSTMGSGALGALLLCACYSGTAPAFGGPGGGGPGGPQLDGGVLPLPDAGPIEAPGGLPCDVSEVVATYCVVCHNGGPAAPSSLRLTSYEDLVAPSPDDASMTVAQRSAVRMRSATEPMPPVPYARVPDDRIAVFEAWVTAGALRGECGAVDAGVPPDGPDPYDTPTVCSSNTSWLFGNAESPLMRPGGACIDCHTRMGEGPRFALAGTVYPTAHEPDDCNGAGSLGGFGGAQVIVTDSAGQVITMTPNQVGNFSARRVSLTLPYTAKVVFEGRERLMLTPQTSGDCNLCHTETGTEMAPGRVMLP